MINTYDILETIRMIPVSYTHLRAHETGRNLVCRLLLEKKNLVCRILLENKKKKNTNFCLNKITYNII